MKKHAPRTLLPHFLFPKGLIYLLQARVQSHPPRPAIRDPMYRYMLFFEGIYVFFFQGTSRHLSKVIRSLALISSQRSEISIN